MSPSEYQARVEQAISTMKAGEKDLSDYWASTLTQRAGASGKAMGSVYPETNESQLEENLLKADWQPYEHPALMAGTSGFKADLPGELGMTSLDSLPDDAEILLMDQKKTGFFSAVVKGGERVKVDHTIIILGQEDGKEIVFTFHPGDPVPKSDISSNGLLAKLSTAKEAKAMGFDLAKLAGAGEWKRGLELISTSSPSQKTLPALQK